MNLKYKKILYIILCPIIPIFIATIFLNACQTQQNKLQDGYFTAKNLNYDKNGWQEYLTIFVNDGIITTVEFNAQNNSGFLRSWDMDYISEEHERTGVNPNYYPRLYASYLIALQDPSRIQSITGGRRTHEIFINLAKAAINQSLIGDLKIIEVDIPPTEYPDDI
jgi:major membrane immunogen (membrane-anchored lipoprotein)